MKIANLVRACFPYVFAHGLITQQEIDEFLKYGSGSLFGMSNKFPVLKVDDGSGVGAGKFVTDTEKSYTGFYKTDTCSLTLGGKKYLLSCQFRDWCFAKVVAWLEKKGMTEESIREAVVSETSVEDLIKELLENISALPTDSDFKYALPTTTGYCRVSKVDKKACEIAYRRNTDGPITDATKLEIITADEIKTFAQALHSGKPIAWDGNSASNSRPLFSFAALTPNVFLQKSGGSLRLFWDPVRDHLPGIYVYGNDVEDGSLIQVTTTKISLPEQKPIADLAAFCTAFAEAAKAAGLMYDDNLVRRFVCAMLAKPFVVLTGLSGSGKTKLAQVFVQWIAAQGTTAIVPVGADWTNSEKLLGYPNALDPHSYVLPDTGVLKLMIDANDNPSVPFFLILDEMNLSHVERYFADFLSAMESDGTIKLHGDEMRKGDDGTPVPPSIRFPKNLFVIGTMNVDETTHMFSPKVLDRAQVIEFRVNQEQIDAFLDAPTKPDLSQVAGQGCEYAAAFLKLHENPIALDCEDRAAVSDPLKQFFPELAELGAEFAFRTAGEAMRFCGFARAAGMSVDEAIDAAVMQKLLPKLHGSRRRLASALEAFWTFCLKKDETATLLDVTKKDGKKEISAVAKYPVSAAKIVRLWTASQVNGFASYAEA